MWRHRVEKLEEIPAVDAVEPPSIRCGVKEQSIRLHLGQLTTTQPKVDITLNDAASVMRSGKEFLIEFQRGLVFQAGTLPAQVEPDAGDVQPQPLARICHRSRHELACTHTHVLVHSGRASGSTGQAA